MSFVSKLIYNPIFKIRLNLIPTFYETGFLTTLTKFLYKYSIADSLIL